MSANLSGADRDPSGLLSVLSAKVRVLASNAQILPESLLAAT